MRDKNEQAKFLDKAGLVFLAPGLTLIGLWAINANIFPNSSPMPLAIIGIFLVTPLILWHFAYKIRISAQIKPRFRDKLR